MHCTGCPLHATRTNVVFGTGNPDSPILIVGEGPGEQEDLQGIPFVSHLIAAIFGLIPNCAASVALTTLCTKGLISAGTMMAGLFSGAGVGLLVLFKVNKHVKDNLIIVGIVVLSGVVFGLLGDLLFSASMFTA